MPTRSVRNPTSKLAHLDACLSGEVEYKKTTQFERFDFINQAAMNISLESIDPSVCFLGKFLKAPLMIAPMTGGVERASELNRLWAKAAEHFSIAMGVGSQRVGIEDKQRAAFYQIRKEAPTALILANIGAGQLCRGWGEKEARQAVEMIEADGLFIHLNAIQEACQDGDVDFRLLLPKITEVVKALKKDGVPVLAREVGFGLSKEAVTRLLETGISGLDCAGAGGTSWAKVEAICAKSERRRQLGLRFAEWGIPTAVSIQNVRAVSKDIPLIATGGLRSGIDLAKAIALGADVGAMARPMLVAAHEGEEALFEWIESVLTELRVCMFGIGATTHGELKKTSSIRVA